ncbi:MAG: DUF3524 domain-containing protein [Saprospiraceae bacterium]|nr:DUF3524 domain-containing protein [Saprospiraceae bacterium]
MNSDPKSLNILLLEPFYGGSHKQWADGLVKHSRNKIHISSLPDRHWKWRMHGSALTFAERHKEDIKEYDLVLVTDLCDVAALRGLLKIEVPVILYFHENQLAYPWSPTDEDVQLKRDRHYIWINFTSAMAADYCWFNSAYNKDSFLIGLPKFLKAFPDQNRFDLNLIEEKSMVMPLGLELPLLRENIELKELNNPPVILWNHRWEYDKNPELFFNILFRLKDEGVEFKTVVLGEKSTKYPQIFDEAKLKLADRIIHFGYVESKDKYHQLLKNCDIYPVTNRQDFFGISVMEAISAGVVPLLPSNMVYSEHFDPEEYSMIYYLEYEELYVKLKNMLIERPQYHLLSEASKYQWDKMIKIYDDALINIVLS